MVPYNHKPRVKGEQMSTEEENRIDTATLIATASNEWANEPPSQKVGERRIVWPWAPRVEDTEGLVEAGFFW
jgi:hypothetical protein